MILIVDDRPENILPLQRILQLHNFETDTANSGEAALKKILKNTYSLIILDVQMPGMDGFEVAENISGFSKAKDIPIIFLSAVSTDKKFVTQGYSSGGIDYLTKPVDPDILILKVRTFMRLYEQQEELKKNKEELSQHMKELRSVLESLPSIAFTLADTGEVEYANKLWFHYSEEVKDLPDPHPDDLQFMEDWKISFKSGKEFNADLRIKNNFSDQYRYHHLRITPIRQDSKIIRWVGTYTDIHQQKVQTDVLEEEVNKRTSELIQKNIELENYNHELQQFTWVVSHDLKEPLRKIQTFNQMVKERYLVEDSVGHRYIDRTISAAERMSTLIDNLLHYSKLSAAHEFQLIDLNAMFKELTDDFEDQIKAKNAQVVCSPLPVVESIPSQLRQVFQNLLSNALKFSKENESPQIKITSELIQQNDFNSAVSQTGKYCRITFSDNGIGFDEQYKEKIFKIFQRLHAVSEYEGTGIGLAIAKKIIEQHKGQISASSELNNGAKFMIVLPLKQTN